MLYLNKEKNMKTFKMVNISNKNRKDVNQFLLDNWYSTDIVIRGEVVDGTSLDGFIVYDKNRIVGLITYIIYNSVCEIVTLNSLEENKGIGTALCNKLKEVAIDKNCKLMRLITTNDNLKALGFYQKRGFVLTKLYPNAMDNVRKIKDIPLIGENNIPLRDELELELNLR